MYLKLRPYLKEFLKDMQDYYELIVYTSADKDYADEIIDFIESDRQYFAHRLYNSQCLIKENLYVFKELDLLCYNRNLKNILIVDNIVRNYSLDIKNGIPILDYEGSTDDLELVYLASYLRKLANEDNPQEAIRADLANFLSNL